MKPKNLFAGLLSILVSAGLAHSEVVISEFVATNGAGLQDADGAFEDWIEIENTGEAAVNLNGYHLTDDAVDLLQWAFPDRELGPGERLIVFASTKNRLGEELHTNFKLNRAAGGYLALTDPAGAVLFAYEDYPKQREDIAYGIQDSTDAWVFLDPPTPAGKNGGGFFDFVADTQFSVRRGIFDEAFEVEITTATEGATIAYTLDGNDPTKGTLFVPLGIDYTGPITIDKTTVLRAYARKTGHRSTDTDTQTYVFPADIIRQTGEGLPEKWGSANADYEMDPEVVDHPDYKDTIIDDFKSLPCLSIAMSPDDFFSSRGIYPGQVAADGLEKPCSAELIFANGEEEAVQIDSTVQVVGGSSVGRWKIHKLSMRLKFDSRLNYPFYGEQGADSFATLVVDARHNNTWAYQGGSEPTNQRARAQYLRDQFSADLQRELGGAAPRGRYVNLLIDGVYWGMYNLHERPDDNFAASYFGGESSDYDCIKHNQSTVIAGTRDGYTAMLAAARADMSKLENFEAAAELIDIDDLINYMMVNFVLGNTDWAHQNWYATANQADNKWRYHSWDAEKGMQQLNDNLTNKDDAGGPTGVHKDLAQSPEYRIRFADLVEKHLKNGGILTTEGLRTVYQRRTDEIDRGVVLESARWGDTATGVNEPYTRNEHWVPQRDYLMNTYFADRPGVVLNQLKDLLAPMDPPGFSQDGERCRLDTSFP